MLIHGGQCKILWHTAYLVANYFYFHFSTQHMSLEPNRPASIEPELKFDKVADRIALFENFKDKNKDNECGNSGSTIMPTIYNKEKKLNLKSDTANGSNVDTSPPPRPPPPVNYVGQDGQNFLSPNYFSLPRNSKFFCDNIDEEMMQCCGSANKHFIIKSSSTSSCPKVCGIQEAPECLKRDCGKYDNTKIVNQMMLNHQHYLPTFNKYITTPNDTSKDQQIFAGRIIG